MLRRAEDKVRAAGLTNVRFLQLAVGAGKLGANQYNRVILVTVLGEIPDRQSALKDIYLSLKPGGILSVTEIMFDPHYQTRQTILQLASPAGFKEKAFFGHRFAFTLHLAKTEKD
jgi:ubiquinone/menaquinone biosynthesis C-methylase UbiE